MKRVFAESVGSVVVVEEAIPEPPAGYARVRTVYAGICGSDTHAVAGQHPLLPPPYFPGHEATGVVDAAGEGADPGLVGRRVVLKPNVCCGECVNCRAGRTNACQTLAWVGCDPSGRLPGAMAEYFVAPAGNLYPVPDDVTDEQAALVECFATPVHAARIAGDLTGARTVIFGAGTIGILQLIAARGAGAGPVVMTDLDPSKRERALRLGADAVVDAASPGFAEEIEAALGGKADVLFDCVAMEGSARQWPLVVRRAATICVVGVPNRDFVVPMPLVQDWELKIQGCANYNELDMEHSLALAQQIPASEIVSARYPFEAGEAAFKVASEHTSGKVLLHGGEGQA